MTNIFEEAEESEIDPIQVKAVELVRGQQRRELRFRLNIGLVILIAILFIDLWRVYRNEMIWNQCVSYDHGIEAHTDERIIAP